MRFTSSLWIAVFAAVALSGFAVSCSARRVVGQKTSLFAHARKAAIKLVVIDPKNPNYAHRYFWLSPTRLRHCYNLENLNMVTQEVDLTTGRYSALTVPVQNLDIGQVEEGPQARWVIRNVVGSSGTYTMAQKGDGTDEWQTHFGVPPAYIWNQDGHRVYETFSKPHGRTLVTERDLEHPAYSRRFWAAGSASEDLKCNDPALNIHYGAQRIVTQSGF